MASFHHALALAFDTDDAEFARGVEIGRLWERLGADAGPITETIHVANAEMAIRLAEATQRAVVSHEHDATWMTVHFDAAADEGHDARAVPPTDCG